MRLLPRRCRIANRLERVKKVFVKSYGCQMNVYDAERMADVLAGEGYAETDAMEEADLVILNTCHIREKAAEKVYSELGRVKALKRERAAAGPRDHGRRRRLRRPGRGPGDPAPRARRRRRGRAAELSSPARAPGERPARARVVDTEFPVEDKFDHLPAARRARSASRGVSAFLTIQEGCDKFCTFCVVPYTRGAEISRPVAKILEEARRLAEAGRARDHPDRPERQRLSRRGAGRLGLDARPPPAPPRRDPRASRACATPRATRATWTTTLIAAHRDLPALMPFLHLPVQSGSDRILDAMNRKHTARRLPRASSSGSARPGPTSRSRRTSSSASRARPMPISTTRCGSSREIGFASAFSFKYSPRPGTPAAEMAAPGARAGQGGAARAAPGAARGAAPGLQPRNRRADPRRSPGEAGPASGPDRGQVALSAAGADRGPTHRIGDDRAGADRRGRARTACSAKRRRPAPVERGVRDGEAI